LKGESPERIKFLRKIIETAPPCLKLSICLVGCLFAAIGKEKEYYLAYFNDSQPGSTIINLPEDSFYSIEIIDTWNMTITPVEKKFSGYSLIELPSKTIYSIKNCETEIK